MFSLVLGWTRMDLTIVLSCFLPCMNQFHSVCPRYYYSIISGTLSSTFFSLWPMFLQLVYVFCSCIFLMSAQFPAQLLIFFFLKPTLSFVFTYSKCRCLSQFSSSFSQFKAPSVDSRQSCKTRTISFASVSMLNI